MSSIISKLNIKLLSSLAISSLLLFSACGGGAAANGDGTQTAIEEGSIENSISAYYQDDI